MLNICEFELYLVILLFDTPNCLIISLPVFLSVVRIIMSDTSSWNVLKINSKSKIHVLSLERLWPLFLSHNTLLLMYFNYLNWTLILHLGFHGALQLLQLCMLVGWDSLVIHNGLLARLNWPLTIWSWTNKLHFRCRVSLRAPMVMCRA